MTSCNTRSNIQSPSNPRLWTVQCFLALISGSENLVPGDGLKRLYVMSSGLNSYDDDDIKCAAAKAEAEGYLPGGMKRFMNTSIVKNCLLYADMLRKMVENRVVDISNGSVSNPMTTIMNSNIRSRKNYYIPPFSFMKQVNTALQDWGVERTDATRHSLWNAANDAEMLLNQLQGREGYIDPQPSHFSAIVNILSRLHSTIDMELYFSRNRDDFDYRLIARPCLKISWFITKLLMGDLNVRPTQQDLAEIDLDKRINFSDATLACIPFPTNQTVSLFSEPETSGISFKGRNYLAAASRAAFSRNTNSQSSGACSAAPRPY